MRVGLVVDQLFAPVPGGTGRYAGELASALTMTAPEESSLQTWSAWHRPRPRSTAHGPEPRSAGQGPRPPASSGTSGLRRLPLGSKVLSRMWERGIGPAPRDADVVHATTLLVPPRRRAALVVTIHDVVPWTHPETLTPRGLGFHRRMGARAAREADLIVTDTVAVADQIRDILSPSAQVIAVHPGFSSGLTVPDDAQTRRARHVGEDDYLLFVGTSEPRKGLDTLLEALSEPALAGQSLVVVGPRGWGGVDVGQDAEARGIGGRVTVTGPVGDADLAALYAGASLVVMPSRAEGFGLPVLEAMALGVPVVTSDDPAMREVGGGASALFPVGDPTALCAAILRVLSDPGLRAQMIEWGRSRAQDFDWLDSARTLWGLYARLAR
jgi:glycosyltransferase involved in cell wall biosynthesis